MNPEELLKKWGPVINATEHIWTWTEPEVLGLCAEIASQSEYMIECGSYLGRSAKVMLLANPDLKLLCIDTFTMAGLEHTFRYFLAEEIARERCYVIVSASDCARELLDRQRFINETYLPFHTVDAVWVDDGHSEQDLRRDITSLMPLIRSSGVMFGHDWDGDNDVARGVKSMIPLTDLTFPHPRVWSYTKP